MAAKLTHPLNDPAVQDRLVAWVRDGKATRAFSAEIDVLPSSLFRFLREHPELGARVEAARVELAAEHPPRHPPRDRTPRAPKPKPLALPPGPDEDPPPRQSQVIIDGEPVSGRTGAPLLGDDETENVRRLCWDLAYGGETVHPVVQQKALDWLCRKTFGMELYERERAADAEAKRLMRVAEREAAETQATDGPLIIGVPSNGSEAPGREPVPSAIIDAEVVH
jgi:hypothetical protein